MSRQMIRTDRHGLAKSTAVRFAAICTVVAVLVLVLFLGLSKAKGPDSVDVPTTSGSAMGAPSPETK